MAIYVTVPIFDLCRRTAKEGLCHVASQNSIECDQDVFAFKFESTFHILMRYFNRCRVWTLLQTCNFTGFVACGPRCVLLPVYPNPAVFPPIQHVEPMTG